MQVIDAHVHIHRAYLDADKLLRDMTKNGVSKAVIFASGNGTPDPRYVSSYWLQVSVLFPMPDVPAPIREILARPSLKRRRATKSQTGPRGGGP